MHYTHGFFGEICTGGMFLLTTFDPEPIKITCTVLLTIAGLINYYYSVKKNREK